MMKMKCLMSILMSLWNVLLAQESITIQRRLPRFDRNDNLIEKPDKFIISVCSGNGSAQCTAMGGTSTDRCKCECTLKNNDGVYYKSTFGFYKEKLQCTDNTIVHGGCKVILQLDYRIASDPPITVESGRKEIYYIPYEVLPVHDTCKLTKGAYLECDGTWKPLNDMKRKFRIKQEDKNSEYNLKLVDDSAMTGRIINITIECGGKSSPKSTNCMIMKVKGQQKCPFPLPSSTSQPSTKVTTLSPSSPSTLQWSTSTSQSSTKEQLPSTRLLSTEPTSTSLPISFVSNNHGVQTTNLGSKPSEKSTQTWEPTSPLSISPTIVKKREKSHARSDDDNSGLIAGVLAGVVGLAAIAFAVVILTRRRKKRHSVSNTEDVAENQSYGKGVDNSLRFTDRGQRSPNEDEYSYAYCDSTASIARKSNQEIENHTSNSQGESNASVANSIYGKTEQLELDSDPHVYDRLQRTEYDKSRKEHPSHSDGQIYNTLGEPVYAKVDKSRKTKSSDNHSEPLYNVLEGPETEDGSPEGNNDEPPCYQVLEGPNTEGAPVYDVLEGPESDEAPVYGSFEGREDPHVYGVLGVRDTQETLENRGYDDMVYDAVGDVIKDQDDVYQQLNHNGQRDSDVYQALSHPNKTMYLKELNQSQSIA